MRTDIRLRVLCTVIDDPALGKLDHLSCHIDRRKHQSVQAWGFLPRLKQGCARARPNWEVMVAKTLGGWASIRYPL